ncbi:isochorismatase family protein [Sporolactobacillus spathodeae]
MERGKMLDFKKTALVLIDLQKGIVSGPSGREAVTNAVKLVDEFHNHHGLVIFVTVDFTDGREILHVISDKPAFGTKPPAGWAELDPALEVHPSDLRLTKRQWGAFFGTELDLQLRRRGIDTIVLAGISTNRGVESTAREAFHLGYNQIFAEDAMTAHTEEEHQASIRYIFPYLGCVRKTNQIVGQDD